MTRYYDLADPALREQHQDMARAVDSNRWTLPLVAVDGQVLFAGYIDHKAIVQVIENKRAKATGG